MKLVQLNTWSCKLPSEIARLFLHEKPDIVSLQEVVRTDFGAKILDTIDSITKEYPFAHEHYTPLIEFKFMDKRVKRGNMISSHHSFNSTSEHWTHGGYTEDFDYTRHGNYNVARNIAYAEVNTPDGVIHVFTLHGYHLKEHKNGNDETLRACKELLNLVHEVDGPVIVAGDFNLAPTSKSIQLVSKSLRNLPVEHDLSTTRNHLTPKTEVCDYIFVNDKLKVTKFYMSDIVASDHNALVLEFTI